MKKFILLSLVAMFSVSCSSTKEKYAEERKELQEERQEELNEIKEEYNEEETELQREEAEELLDESEDVEIKRHDDANTDIKVEE